MGKDVKTAAFVILDKYLDATDENINKEQIVNAMIEYAELRLSKERGSAESSHKNSGLNKPDVSGLVCKCGNQTFTHRHSNWIECTACNKIKILQACHYCRWWGIVPPKFN